VAEGNVTGSGGSTHSRSYRDVEAVSIKHCARLAYAGSCWRRCP
jgi:hypothetical protein